MSDAHYLGEFQSLSAVWKMFPNGAGYGDHIIIDGVRLDWDESTNSWGEDTGGPVNPALPEIVNHDIDVQGTVIARDGIKTADYIPGEAGAFIDGAGNAEFRSVAVDAMRVKDPLTGVLLPLPDFIKKYKTELPPDWTEYTEMPLFDDTRMLVFDENSSEKFYTTIGALKDVIGSGESSGGGTVDIEIIRSDEPNKIPTDNNVFSALRTLKEIGNLQGSSHSHSNKSIIDQLTQGNIDVLSKLSLDAQENIKVDATLWATGELSAFGLGDDGDGGESGGNFDRLDKWGDYNATKAEWVLSAFLGKDLDTRVTDLEQSSGSVTSVGISVPTGLSVANSPITSSGVIEIGLQTEYSIPTTVKQANWDTAFDNNHTHSNKTQLDLITQSNIDVLARLSIVNDNLQIDGNAYATGELSAYGVGDGGGGGGPSYERLDDWTDYAAEREGWVLSALLGKDLDTRVSSLEGGSATTVTTTGTGNAITEIEQAGTIITATKGSTFAELGGDGKILSSQLPSYVDDVLEFANLSSFPNPGETGKIYIALNTNLTYRWSGTAYVEISASLALGETPSTAYRGDHGKIAYDHSQSEHQTIIDGVGFVKANGKLLSYDNNSYALASHAHGKITNTGAIGTTANLPIITTTSGVLNTTTVTNFKTILDLNNVNNISDLNKPISNATQDALNLKLDKLTFDDLFEKVEISTGVYAIEAKYNFYSVGEVSAYGLGSTGGGGSGLVETVYGYNNLGQTFNNTTLTDTFNAYTINRINTRLVAVEDGLASHDHPFTEITGAATTDQIPNLPTSKITSGRFATARLGSGTASSSNYLRGDGTWVTPPDTKYSVATTGADGLMSSGDKSKLNGIATNANNYSLPTASSTTLGGVKIGSRLTISSGTLSANVQSDNNFTSAYKTKLDGIASNANNYTHPASHSIGFITGLQDALDGKSATGHTHSNISITAGTGLSGGGALSATRTLSIASTYAPNTSTNLGASKNLNDYRTAGFYHQTANANATTALNYPVASAGSLLVQTAAGVIQTYKVYNSSNVYVRGYYGTTWSSWRKLALVTDNVASATKLQTARTINGTSFNGSADITTTRWGTSRTLSYTGDVTGSSSVNGSENVATAMTLANSGVTAGTYRSVTVDAKGRVTAGTNPTTVAGYGLTDAVTTNTTQTITGTKTFTKRIGANLGIKIGAHATDGLIEWDATNNVFKFNGSLYATGEVSAYGIGSGGGSSGGIIETVHGYSNLGQTFNNTTLTDTFNAYTINRINTRLVAVEDGLASHDHPFTAITGTATTTQIPNLPTSKITSGRFATARLGSGTASSSNYLRGDGTWVTPPDTKYSVATTSANGLMSYGDKSKLNGIASNANNYSHPSTHPASMITTGTLAGIVKAQNNTSYTTKQVRNIILSTADASAASMANGDIWIKYE